MSPVLSVIIIVITCKVIVVVSVLKLCLSPMWANVGICGLIDKLNPWDYSRMMPIGLMCAF